MQWYPNVYFTSQKLTACLKKKVNKTKLSHFKWIPSLSGFTGDVLTLPVLILHVHNKPKGT